MLDHVSIRIKDYSRSKKFYEAALAPLGYTLAMENSSGAGFRRGFIPSFWVKQGEPLNLSEAKPDRELAGCGGAAVHVAFASDNRRMVEAFYRAALAAAGRTMAHPACVPSITRTTTVRSFSIQTVTTSKRCVTRVSDELHACFGQGDINDGQAYGQRRHRGGRHRCGH